MDRVALQRRMRLGRHVSCELSGFCLAHRRPHVISVGLILGTNRRSRICLQILFTVVARMTASLSARIRSCCPPFTFPFLPYHRGGTPTSAPLVDRGLTSCTSLPLEHAQTYCSVCTGKQNASWLKQYRFRTRLGPSSFR